MSKVPPSRLGRAAAPAKVRLRYRVDPRSRYFTVAAYDGEARVGHVDWCAGRYHLVVEGVGYLGAYASENSAKAGLRYYLRRLPRQAGKGASLAAARGG
jgi:hypothetical protein